MEHEFWRQTWNDGHIAFHQATGNPMLVSHLDALDLAPGDRVFVPLCGKTRDIGHLLAAGLQVVGIELVELAVHQLFDELDLQPRRTTSGNLVRHSGGDLEVFVGDVFDLSSDMLGRVDAVYDRAALVALPPDLQARYAAHLVDVAGAAPQLLLTYVHDPALLGGPPFSIDGDRVERLYGATYEVVQRDRAQRELKGIAATECVWHLVPA